MQVVLPVGRYSSCRTRHGLVEGMMLGRGEPWTALEYLPVSVVVVPALARLEAGDNGVAGRVRMGGGVLRRGSVAAADVPALRAPAQVEPPAAGFLALATTRSARRRVRIDPG